MPDKYGIVILGAGNAGFGVSQIAHTASKSIALVDSDDRNRWDRSVEPRENRTAFDLAEGEVGFQRTDPRRT